MDYSTTTSGDLTLILRNRFDTGTTATGGIRMFGKAGEDMTLLREDNPLGSGDPRLCDAVGTQRGRPWREAAKRCRLAPRRSRRDNAAQRNHKP